MEHYVKTPYQRLLESEHITPEAKPMLGDKPRDLNPFALKRMIDQKVERILQFISVPFFNESTGTVRFIGAQKMGGNKTQH